MTQDVQATFPQDIVQGPSSLGQTKLYVTDSVREAARKLMRVHFQRMLQHEPGTLQGDDVEELHDMRVATRRLRAAFRIFGPYFDDKRVNLLNKGLRRAGRALGRVRDLDVFITKSERFISTASDPHFYELEPLLTYCHDQRDAARTSMIALLESPKHKRFVTDLSLFLQDEDAPIDRGLADAHRSTLCHVLPDLIKVRYLAVSENGPDISGVSLDRLHRLRIDCKRLRYLLEFTRDVLDPEAESLIQQLVGMQDHLGDLVDADVASGVTIGFLADWIKDAERGDSRIQGIAQYLIARQDELHRLRDSLPEKWRRFNRPELQDLLNRTVGVLTQGALV